VADDWREAEVALVFALSDRPLFRWRARGLTRSASPVGAKLAANEIRLPPPHEIDRGIDALLVRSQPVTEDLPVVSTTEGWIRYVPQVYERYFIDLGGTFEAYLARFSAKSRSTLQRKVRKFAQTANGEMKWKEYRSPDEIEAFLPVARAVSQLTYQERLLGAGLPLDSSFEQEARALAEVGALRGYLLFSGDRAVAYMHCPIQNDALIYQYVGYDPEFAQHSPGTVLQYLALEHLFAEQRVRWFDFTEGQGEHKRTFSTGSVRCANVYYFRPGLSRQLIVRAHLALARASEGAGALLERAHLKSVARRLLRGAH
jgi:hypothetical protein